MQVKERPILFSAPMVRASLDDTKTQTRRVAKLTDAAHIKEVGGHRRWHPADPDVILASPYGQVGDQLWVRETWGVLYEQFINESHEPTFWRADYSVSDLVEQKAGTLWLPRWKPSIHMPRNRSRITLEITGVRVERLQDISEADATAEGTPHSLNHPAGRTAIENYEHLWECLNGDDSWYLNPYVWVIEFKKVKP